jgi:hypothetical protein
MTVELYPFDSEPGNYEFWTKCSQIVEISRSSMIIIHFFPILVMTGYFIHRPDWEIITEYCRIYGVRLHFTCL